ncbi:hypothetical protein DSAG12_02276 [Promethearchaeum syntrophicum]|uniref:Uncharacterized protein n=1 Tax=Promethearchaeum syntrophicum TaxID=2594042 RepID=A0A5B9DCL5_9ARCH|nr:hypothetical protein [Candidatus Prometheoarchaeum syntrophicum]
MESNQIKKPKKAYHLEARIDPELIVSLKKSNLKINRTVEMLLRKYLKEYNALIENMKFTEVSS